MSEELNYGMTGLPHTENASRTAAQANASLLRPVTSDLLRRPVSSMPAAQKQPLQRLVMTAARTYEDSVSANFVSPQLPGESLTKGAPASYGEAPVAYAMPAPTGGAWQPYPGYAPYPQEEPAAFPQVPITQHIPFRPEQLPAAEAVPAAVKMPVTFEAPVATELPVAFETPVPMEAPTHTEAPAPAAAEIPMIFEPAQPATAEAPVRYEQPATFEVPVLTEAPTPAAAEIPVIFEPAQPAAAEAPVHYEQPVTFEAPVFIEAPAPAAAEIPVNFEPAQPAAAEAPVHYEQPVTFETPVLTETPVHMEVPAPTVSAPIATEIPMTSLSPQPAAVEAPAPIVEAPASISSFAQAVTIENLVPDEQPGIGSRNPFDSVTIDHGDDEDDEDEAIEPAALPDEPKPVPVSMPAAVAIPDEDIGGPSKLVVLMLTMTLLVSIAVIYVTGVINPVLKEIGIPIWTELTSATADVDDAVPEVFSSSTPIPENVELVTAENTVQAQQTTVLPASPTGIPKLTSMNVTPSVSKSPSTLVFTLYGNAAVTNVQLRTRELKTLLAECHSTPSGDGTLWQFTVDFNEPYQGTIHAYLLDGNQNWIDSEYSCQVNVQ